MTSPEPNGGLDPRASYGPEISEALHRMSDVGRGPRAQHHYIGTGANDVASGDHKHEIAFPPGVPVGTLTMYAGSLAPLDWLLCQGQAVSRTTYAALFEVCGTTFGAGDGSTTFNVPNLVNRFPKGATATSRGAVGGTSSHSHGAVSHNHSATSSFTGSSHNHFQDVHDHFFSGTSHTHSASSSFTGSDHSHAVAGHSHASAAHTHPGDGHTHGTDQVANHAHTYTQGVNGAAATTGSGAHSHTTTNNAGTTGSTTPNNTGATATAESGLKTQGGSVGTSIGATTAGGAVGGTQALTQASTQGGSVATSIGATTVGADSVQNHTPPFLDINFIIKAA